MKIKFLQRDIHPLGPYITLCKTEKQYKKTVKYFKITTPNKWVSAGKDATAHTLEHGDTGELACVVCIDAKRAKSRSLADVCGLLAHEAVHVWQAHRDQIGEGRPGVEQEAYAIGMITQALVAEWLA